MATQEIKVPDLGGIDEVDVIEVCVAPGDSIEAEGALIVLESDKASMEVPSPIAGKIVSISVNVGDQVSEGSLVGVVETESEATSTSTDQPQEAQTSKPETHSVSAPDATETSSESNQELKVTVPDLGGIDDVEIIELSVAIGDSLNQEDPILVLESDKATMEVPSPAAGTLLSFNVAIGDKVKTGDWVATLNATGQIAGGKSDTPTAMPSKTENAAASVPSADSAKGKAASQVAAVSVPSGNNVHAGPAVRKLARELGVDLTQVSRTGPKNRVLKEDLHNFVKQRINAPQSAGPMQIQGSSEDFSRYGEIDFISLNKIKQATAKNMVASWTTIPQVTQFDEADITELENYRKTKAAAMAPDGVKITPLAFILKAVVKALQAFPNFNASLGPDGTELIRKHYFNLGIAVDTPEGLLVPNIKQADQKGVIEFAQDSAALAQKARDKKLPMDAMAGTSFTISSLGGIGGTAFTPIVNEPQVAILGVAKAQRKPVWNGNEFEPRLMLPISVSYDHRVIDGAEGAKFTRYVCELLSDLRHLIL